MARLDLHGDPLPPFALARLGTVRWRHRGLSVHALVFSRDGRTVYASDGGVTALDVTTGAVRWSVTDPSVAHVAILPDPRGDHLAAVGPGGKFTRFDVDGTRLASLALPSHSLTALAVSRDGGTVFVGGFKPYGALLAPDGSLRATLPVEGGMYLNSGTFSPDGATLATTDAHAQVALWSVADARLIRTFGRADLQPNDAAFTPDGRLLVVGTCSGQLIVFDVASGEAVARWKAHQASVHRVAVTADGLHLVTASEDGNLSLWRLADGERLATRGGGFGVPALALSPDGATVASSVGPRVALLDLATLTERFPVHGHTTAIQCLVVSRDDAAAVTVPSPGDVRWWSLDDGRPLATLALDRFVTDLRPLPEGDCYALQPDAHATTVIDVAARAFTKRPETSAEVHQKWWGRAAEAVLFAGRLTLTNARGERNTRKAMPLQLVITPDDRHAVYLERNALIVWDLDAHAVAATVKVRAALGLAPSPRGDEVVVWSRATVERIGAPDGALRATWKAPKDDWVSTVAYAPDGARMAVVTYHAVFLIDVASGAEVARMEGHGALTTTAAFDHAGRRLVTAGWDTTGLVWSVDEAMVGHAALAAPKAKRTKSAR
jgi:WD40 repeat protein